MIFLVVLIFSLLQATFLPLNLVLWLVILWSARRPEEKSLYLAVGAGLILDLAKGGILGFSSLLFLVTRYLLILYSRRFNSLHPAFLIAFMLMATFVYAFFIK